jgi:hypothetical protein
MLATHGATPDELEHALAQYRQQLAEHRAVEVPKLMAWLRRGGDCERFGRPPAGCFSVLTAFGSVCFDLDQPTISVTRLLAWIARGGEPLH